MSEVTQDAVGNRCGDFMSEYRRSKQFFLLRIGNERGFNEHRGNIGRFQYHKCRLFRVFGMQMMHWRNVFNDVRTQEKAFFYCFRLFQIEKYFL